LMCFCYFPWLEWEWWWWWWWWWSHLMNDRNDHRVFSLRTFQGLLKHMLKLETHVLYNEWPARKSVNSKVAIHCIPLLMSLLLYSIHPNTAGGSASRPRSLRFAWLVEHQLIRATQLESCFLGWCRWDVWYVLIDMSINIYVYIYMCHLPTAKGQTLI
jgi:hypothetical protein